GAREKRMLVIGGVVDARREEHNGRIRFPRRREVTQNVEELLAVIFHRPDTVLSEQIWKDPAHDLAILDDIGNAGWAARIVLQHEKITVAIADQIGAANVDVDISRHIEVHELWTKVRGLPDVIFRNHAIAQNGLTVIDVVQKKIERSNSLFKTALNFLPFFARNDSRDEIEWKNPLGPLGIAVNREGDALAQESERGQVTLAIEFSFRQLGETLQQPLIMGPGPARHGKHLIIEFARIVAGEELDHEFSLSSPLWRLKQKRSGPGIWPSPQSSPMTHPSALTAACACVSPQRESLREGDTGRGCLGNQGARPCEAPGEGSPFLRQLGLTAPSFFVARTSRKNGAVRLTRLFATCSGVPVATISPPASPASGPISTM